jgi:hypothetical protein
MLPSHDMAHYLNNEKYDMLGAALVSSGDVSTAAVGGGGSSIE